MIAITRSLALGYCITPLAGLKSRSACESPQLLVFSEKRWDTIRPRWGAEPLKSAQEWRQAWLCEFCDRN